MNEEEEARIARQRAAAALTGDHGKGVLAVDFDDTITADPEAAIATMVALREAGYGLVVFTSNADHDGIRSWLKARWPDPCYFDPPPVTDVKPQASAYIDDKAHRFTTWDEVKASFL